MVRRASFPSGGGTEGMVASCRVFLALFVVVVVVLFVVIEMDWRSLSTSPFFPSLSFVPLFLLVVVDEEVLLLSEL